MLLLAVFHRSFDNIGVFYDGEFIPDICFVVWSFSALESAEVLAILQENGDIVVFNY